jgi:hypothetical protein
MIIRLRIVAIQGSVALRMKRAAAKSESFSLQNEIQILKSVFVIKATVAVAQW